MRYCRQMRLVCYEHICSLVHEFRKVHESVLSLQAFNGRGNFQSKIVEVEEDI